MGPGFRVPFYTVSPYSRGKITYPETCDHGSQILFLEEWLKAKGTHIFTEEFVTWRRDNMCNLTQVRKEDFKSGLQNLTPVYFRFWISNILISLFPRFSPPMSQAWTPRGISME
jgi:hypothetical protein